MEIQKNETLQQILDIVVILASIVNNKPSLKHTVQSGKPSPKSRRRDIQRWFCDS